MVRKKQPKKTPKRGERVEDKDKVSKILMTTGMVIIGALILGLIIAVIVIAAKPDKKPENRLEGVAIVEYQDLENLFSGNITILGESEQTKPAMEEFIKKESVVFFLTEDEIYDDEIIQQLKDFPTEERGAALYIITGSDELLKPGDKLFEDVENVDKTLVPFAIRVTETASKFEFIGGLELVKNILKEGN